MLIINVSASYILRSVFDLSRQSAASNDRRAETRLFKSRGTFFVLCGEKESFGKGAIFI